MIYTEKENKNILRVSTTDNLVSLTVDCQYGTLASVSFYHDTLKTVSCGESEPIGTAKELKGKTIEFNGSSGNPEESQIRIIHTICENGCDGLVYIFPDDYTGNPAFDEKDKEPSYVFNVTFI